MLPSSCSAFLVREKCGGVDDRPGADHQVGLAGEDRRGQLRDVVGAVLVVGVGVDDHVGAGAQRGLEAGGERAGQALVAPEADDVIDAGGLGDRDRRVGAAVVDHHPFDPREARHRARQGRERDAERRRLVEAGDLDDQRPAARPSHGSSAARRHPPAALGVQPSRTTANSRASVASSPCGSGSGRSQAGGSPSTRRS